MKTKTLPLAAGAAVLLFASSSIASTNTVISSSSVNSVRISSARVVRALGGGSYVTGMTEPSFGYAAPRAVHVHVAAYDANGKLLAEKIDKINGNNLVRWHLRPRPRAPYTVFFPWEPSQMAKVTVVEHSGYTHICLKNCNVHGSMDTMPKETSLASKSSGKSRGPLPDPVGVVGLSPPSQ